MLFSLSCVRSPQVSVDVMSPVAGTVVAHLAAIDDNVVVGAPLFTVDDSLAPAAGAKPSASAVAPAAPTPAAAAAAAPAATGYSGPRTPLIKFLGKRSLLPHVPIPKHASELAAAATTRAAAPVRPSGPGVLDFSHTKRLPLSPSEITAINSGVAFL
jgi:pyruvate/2-oxoglutarate dehydrogenase complex dihydrolipoamide acyltransferase (E2) component